MNSEQTKQTKMMRNRLMERMLERYAHEPSSARALQQIRNSVQAAETAEAGKAAEDRAASDRSCERLKKEIALKHAAKAALSLARMAKTPEDMLVKAETAVAKYMEYKALMTSRCDEFNKELARAKDIAALAQLELEKHPIQRWIEKYWDLFF